MWRSGQLSYRLYPRRMGLTNVELFLTFRGPTNVEDGAWGVQLIDCPRTMHIAQDKPGYEETKSWIDEYIGARILRQGRQARGDDGGALCPRQAIQPSPPAIADPAQQARTADRDIGRKIAGHQDIEAAFALPRARASQIRGQQQRGWKLYSFHAPETECIGKGKASAPYEFGVKVSIVTTNARAPGGQFVLHAKALPGNPYDGHTLRDV